MHKNNREETGIREISLENLRIHPKNIRKEYNDIDELTASIREKGILQNLTVVPDPEVSDGYLVVIGNRRLTAARNAGLKTAPCRIVEDMPESEQVMAMLTENMQRSNLTVSEEAAGIQMCLSDFGFTIEDIAQKTGLSQTTVRHRANIAKLNQQVLRSKEADEGFQLNLTDLTRLEKVSNIATRNKILKEARDSKELAWKAQSAAEEEKRAKVTKKLVAMAKKEGIAPAPEGTDREMYSGKWNTVKEYSLTEDAPELLYNGDDKDSILYIIQYRSFKLIRKAPKEKKIPMLRYYSVFHISQVDGIEPLPQEYDLQPLDSINSAEVIFTEYINREGIRFVQELHNEAYYSPSRDMIHLPLREQFKDQSKYYSTLFHETIHSTGHPSRLSRLDPGLHTAHFGSENYSKEELVAELGAANILNYLGMETEESFANSTAYIQNWLHVLRGDSRFIVSAASKAENAVKYILGGREASEHAYD